MKAYDLYKRANSLHPSDDYVYTQMIKSEELKYQIYK